MSDVVVCPFSSVILEMVLLRSCRGGGSCGRGGWAGEFGKCPTLKRLENEKKS